MLSRVANAIYWASRYVERAENVARFIDVNLSLMLDTPSGQRPSWAPLVQTTGDLEWFLEHYGEPSKESVTRFLTFDKRYPNSIISAVTRARENLQTVREVVSRDMWQELNALYLHVKDAAIGGEDALPEEMGEFYDRVKLAGIHFEGVTNATLSHGEAWHFSRLGRMLERADKTSRILDVKYFILRPSAKGTSGGVDHLGWSTLLDSASALQMYRQRYHVTTPEHVSEFLLLNRDFPRAIHHCIIGAQKSLHTIAGTPLYSYTNSAERQLGQLRANLAYADIAQVMDAGLHDYLDVLQTSLNDIGGSINDHFFSGVS